MHFHVCRLAERGCNVTGVEYAPKAIVEFFDEQKLEYDVTQAGEYSIYQVHCTNIISNNGHIL
jgi:hypothetical protein